jgi:hypothetical protein
MTGGSKKSWCLGETERFHRSPPPWIDSVSLTLKWTELHHPIPIMRAADATRTPGDRVGLIRMVSLSSSHTQRDLNWLTPAHKLLD